jgi:hypothetical protein
MGASHAALSLAQRSASEFGNFYPNRSFVRAFAFAASALRLSHDDDDSGGSSSLPYPLQRENSDEGRNQAWTSFRQLTHPPLGCQSRLSCQCLLRTSHKRHPEADRAARVGNCPESDRLQPYGSRRRLTARVCAFESGVCTFEARCTTATHGESMGCVGFPEHF